VARGGAEDSAPIMAKFHTAGIGASRAEPAGCRSNLICGPATFAG
jgi:hypothetical protein